MSVCRRDGCEKEARRDEFCCTVCAKLHYGTIVEPLETLRERRNRKARIARLRKKHGAFVEVENPEAMEHVVDSNFGGGRKGQIGQRTKWKWDR